MKPNGEFYAMDFDAWDEGTVDLSLEEEAAYLRICHQIYRRHGPIPNSDKLLCSLWRCHQNKARPMLQRLISKGKIQLTEGGHLTNGRATRELDTRETLRRHRVDAGHTGGIHSGHVRRKSLENKESDEAKRSTLHNNTIHNKEEKEDAPSAPSSYFFEQGRIRLNEKDFKQWEAAFKNINLRAELMQLSDWAKAQGKNWFHAVKGALAKKDREAIDRQRAIDAAMKATGTKKEPTPFM